MASSIKNLESSKQLLSPVWTRLSNVVVEKGLGTYVYTTCGKKLLDFTSGIGVLNTGHCHPKVVEAVQKQAATLVHNQMGITYHKPMLELAEELKPVMPEGLDQFFFSNSGAEGIEAALKLAMQATKRQNIITFNGSFHGRTIGAMSVTNSKTVYRTGYGPLLGGISVAPYAYCHRCQMKANCSSKMSCCDDPLQQIETILKTRGGPADTAAILVEPVLGEGGYVMPPKSFMQGIRKLCDKHGILMIADEVQTGFGRTGKYFAVEHFDVTPDIIVFSKAIASGYPISGIAASKELHKLWVPGSHGGTFGGNAVACAAATATQKVIKEEKLVENCASRGKQLTQALESMKQRYPQIADIRGPGLMIGVEFFTEEDNDYPFPGHEPRYAVKKGFAGALTKKCVDNGMLLLNTGGYETARFIPPLTVTEEEIQMSVDIFEKSLKETLMDYAPQVEKKQATVPIIPGIVMTRPAKLAGEEK